MKKYISLAVFLMIVFTISGISSIITMPEIAGWYAGINKPSFNPPNWIFGPVWTTLYILIAISGWMVWNKLKGSPKNKLKGCEMLIYGQQLLFNFLWSIFFFELHRPLVAFIDILALLFYICLNIKAFYKISKPAAYILMPYFLWVAFATVLNFEIIRLN